jgi:hypothetical protein
MIFSTKGGEDCGMPRYFLETYTERYVHNMGLRVFYIHGDNFTLVQIYSYT